MSRFIASVLKVLASHRRPRSIPLIFKSEQTTPTKCTKAQEGMKDHTPPNHSKLNSVNCRMAPVLVLTSRPWPNILKECSITFWWENWYTPTSVASSEDQQDWPGKKHERNRPGNREAVGNGGNQINGRKHTPPKGGSSLQPTTYRNPSLLLPASFFQKN